MFTLRKSEGGWIAVLEGELLPDTWEAVYSPDPCVGRGCGAFAARNKDGWYIVHRPVAIGVRKPEVRKYGPYTDIHSLRIHPCTGDVGWAASQEDGEIVYICGREVPTRQDHVYRNTLQYTPDGGQWGYVAEERGLDFVVIVTPPAPQVRRLPSWHYISPLSFRIGPPLSYLAGDGVEVFWIQGVGQGDIRGPICPNGEREVWIVGEPKGRAAIVMYGYRLESTGDVRWSTLAYEEAAVEQDLQGIDLANLKKEE